MTEVRHGAATVGVIGAGAAGCGVAATIGRTAEVMMWSRPGPRFAEIKAKGRVALVEQGQVRDVRVRCCDTLNELCRACDLVAVCVDAAAQDEIAGALRPHVREGHRFVLVPGHTGGSWRFRAVLQQEPVRWVPAVSELSLPFVGRSGEPGVVDLLQWKREVVLAVDPVDDVDDLPGIVEGWVCGRARVVDVTESGLENMTAVLQPAVMVGNAARVGTGEAFTFYRQGVSREVAALVERLDEERLSVAEALGYQVRSCAEWLGDTYGSDGDGLYERVHSTAGYRDVVAPTNLRHRFLLEHVPRGTVPLAVWGRTWGVPTEGLSALCTLASSLVGEDLWRVGEAYARDAMPR